MSNDTSKIKIVLEYIIERLENAERVYFPKRGYAHIYKDGVPKDCYATWDAQFANLLTAIQNRDYSAGFIPDYRGRITVYKGNTPHHPQEIVFPSNLVCVCGDHYCPDHPESSEGGE